MLLLKGRVMPMASMAEAMVLAVYMPPQAPAPENKEGGGEGELVVANMG
jgi:hypothetical protein